MNDEIIAEINQIIKEFDLAKKSKTGIYAEKKSLINEIPADLPEFLRQREERKPRFFISFKMDFEYGERDILLKEIEINEKLGNSCPLLPNIEEFFRKRYHQPVLFGKNLIVRPEDEFDEYSYQFLEILKSLYAEKSDYYIGKRKMKIPYFLLGSIIPIFEKICLNYMHRDIIPEIDIYEKDEKIVIDTEKLQGWYPLGRNYIIYEDQDKDYKIVKAEQEFSSLFALRKIAAGEKIVLDKGRFDLRRFVKEFEKILKINGIEELEKSLYKPMKIEAGIEFDADKDLLTAKVEGVFDGKRKSEIEEGVSADPIEIKKKISKAEDLLVKKGFVYDSETQKFFMTSPSKIFEFVNENLKTEQKEFSHFHLFYTSEFQKRKYEAVQIKIRIKKKKEFVFYVESGILSKLQAAEILKINKPAKKYYRLENGDIVKLEKTDIAGINKVLYNISATENEIEKGEIKRSRYFDFFLNNYNLTADNCKDYFKIVPEADVLAREYQKFGVNWMLNLKDKNMGGILADDMGLGKTLQALAYLRIHQEMYPNDTHMVVVPKAVLYNWESEIKKFFKDLKYRIIAGEPIERKEKIGKICQGEVVFTSYTFLAKDVLYYSNFKFSSLILDEAQTIKNRNSLMFKSVTKIEREACFALTGTPIENNLLDLWTLFETVLPGYLGTSTAFRHKYIFMNNNEILKSFIKPFILRRIKNKVERQLPDKNEHNVILELEPEQRKIYERAVIECTEKVLADDEIKTFQILKLLTKLRKICTYPETKEENGFEISGKEKVLDTLLEKLIQENHKVIVFSQFTKGLKVLKEKYSKKYKTLYLDGDTAARKRVKLVEKFNMKNDDIFFISLKAGGVGLNIIGADTVIHYDPWWNPAVELQATDRAYRIGQKSDVTVYNLITKSTIEEYIHKLKEEKKALSKEVLDDDASFIFSRDDLIRFFKCNKI